MLNQAASDKYELAKLLNISDEQMNHIQNVEAGHGLIKVGSNLVPFENKFPRNTKLYGLMSTRPGEGLDQLKAEAAVAANNDSAFNHQTDGSEQTEQLNHDAAPVVKEESSAKPGAQDLVRTEREKMMLKKIAEVARSKEEYDALVKRYITN